MGCGQAVFGGLLAVVVGGVLEGVTVGDKSKKTDRAERDIPTSGDKTPPDMGHPALGIRTSRVTLRYTQPLLIFREPFYPG